MDSWKKNVSALEKTLLALSVTDSAGNEIDTDEAFEVWKNKAVEIRESGKSIYFIGNGASASIASHIAADIDKNARIKTHVFTDLSLLTAIANDLGYEKVFSEPLSRRITGGEMLVAISSSGNSANILTACGKAGKLGGWTVTLSAMKRENPLRKLGRLNFYAPAGAYGLAETCHAAILHTWVDRLIEIP